MLLAAVLLLLTVLAREPSDAHRGKRLYVIPEITEEMLRMLWNDPGESQISELEAGKIIGFDLWGESPHAGGYGESMKPYLLPSAGA